MTYWRDLLDGLANLLREFNESVREAPLVVVPTEHLDLTSTYFGERCVEDGRMRITNDVVRNQRRFGILEVSSQRPALGGLTEGLVDLFLCDFLLQRDGEVGD